MSDLAKNGKVIAFGMQKGGVGKTTISVNTAAYFAQKGFRTLIVDTDTQGTATDYFLDNKPTAQESIAKLFDLQDAYNIISDDGSFIQEVRPNLYLAPSCLFLSEVDRDGARLPKSFERLRMWMEATAKKQFDYIIIDCPPSMSFMAQNSMIAADYVIIPLLAVSESYDALKLYIALLQKAKRLRPEIGVLGCVLNKYVDRRIIASFYSDKLQKCGVPVLATIHETVDFEKLAHNKAFVSDYPDLANERIGKEMSDFAEKLRSIIGEK